MRILIVEDNDTYRKLLRITLESEQQDVVEARDGLEALEALNRTPIDAIVSDILMPNMDGFQLCSRVRNLPEFDSVPFLFHTSTYLSPVDESLALKLGADAFLKKPSPASAILAEIARVKSTPVHRVRPPQPLPISPVMKEYSEVLIRKLEKKNLDMEKAREELQLTNESLKKLSSAVEQGADHVVITNRDGIIEYVNPAFERLTGFTKEEAIGKTPAIVKSGKHGGAFYEEMWQALLSGRTFRFQFINKKKNGELYYTEETINPVRDDDGRITHFVSTGKDVSLARLAEEALAASEERYRLLFENNPLPMWVYDLETLVFLAVNPAAVHSYGYSKEEFLSLTIKDIRPENDVPALLENIEKTRTASSNTGPWRHRRKDGTILFVEIISHEVLFGQKKARLVLAQDVSERVIAERALREAEEKYRSIFENAIEGIYQSSPEGRILTANPSMARMLGYDNAQEMITELNDVGHQLYVDKTRRRELVHLLNLQGDVRGFESEVYHRKGHKIWIYENVRNVRDGDGTVLFYEGTIEEITQWKSAQEALRRSEQRYRTLAEAAQDHIFIISLDYRMLFLNGAAAKAVRRSAESAIGMRIEELFPPNFYEEQAPYLRKVVEEGTPVNLETFLPLPGGEVWMDTMLVPIQDDAGNVTAIMGISRDITGRKRAEEERKQLEKQLVQAQKIEAIGQLAGGVAHDYNNTLMAIGGYAELLLMITPEDSPMRKFASEIQKAVTHGADLTRQLLAFSRRQVLQPKVLDLNQAIQKISDMLRRLIGEDIQAKMLLAKNVGLIKADPGQIQQVILNLAINARDAMPDGGILTIETANLTLEEDYVKSHAYVSPGRYVQLTVSDTGGGMDEETVSRIFEPFFTTKEEGKGTGLGLSTVYGIVKQSGGHVSVYSQLTLGTTFKIYFPRVDEPIAAEGPQISGNALLGNGEVILLVDDHQAIRTALGALLEMKGYKVLQAESGKHALETSATFPGNIQLLITDVVMPGMSGRELVRQLAKNRPDIKVLFMSGYSQEAIRGQGELDPGASFLSKPATTQAILAKIRELLS